MGGRGAGAVKRAKGARLNPADIGEQRSLISEREGKAALVDAALDTLREIRKQYGEIVGDLNVAEIKGKSATGVLGFSDGDNIGINRRYFSEAMNKAYDESIKAGYHPSRGDKTGLQAVLAHEMGHNLTMAVARKMGHNNLDEAARVIVEKARQATKHRGVVQMASKISGYATANNAETVAEAMADVYANGSKATRESRAVMDVVRSYL